jgi:hypothetical protein
MAKDFVELFKKLGKFKNLPQLDHLPKELQQLNENWHTLSRRDQEVILIVGRVRPLPPASAKARNRPAKRGGIPEWLLTALNILKDSTRYLSDSEIARRVGVILRR